MSRSRSKGAQRRRGRAGAGSGQGNAYVSMGAYRATRGVDALTPAFVHWYDDGADDAADALIWLEPVKDVLGHYLQQNAEAEVTGFDPEALGEAIAVAHMTSIDGQIPGPADAEYALFLVHAVRVFVEFLTETGRWSGSAEQLADIRSYFAALINHTGEIDDSGDGGIAENSGKLVSVADTTEEETAEFFAGLPVVRNATALLRWLGNGKPVTKTGALRVRDLEAAASCVGMDIRGGARSGLLPDGVRVVRTMWEAPLLAQTWAALVEAGLVVLGYHPDDPWGSAIMALQASVLSEAITTAPPSLERFLATPDFMPEEERLRAGLLTRSVLRHLQTLADQGLLLIDTHVRVPPALIGCVVELLALPILQQLFDGGQDLGQTEQKQPQPVAGPVLQLKILLKNSKPPIWRRVLVPAGLPLPQLHRIIQAVFEWEDYHLHHFRTGDWRGPIYAPLEPGQEYLYGERDLDEAKATIGELLPGVGSSMTYTYDFGDNWQHAVTVEKVLPDDDGGQLPRCTGGRCAAPAEDSGGVWGWQNVVDAVNDPAHPEHGEYRRWLSLEPGEVLDPKAFDLDDVNEHLADLF